MSKPWFRAYNEFATDPKVQSMSEAEQRRLFMLFCLRSSETLQTLHVTDLCFALRISPEELAGTKELFIQKKFIDEHWHIMNWDKRQYAESPSAERVRRHRDKKKSIDVTDYVTPDSVTETLHVTPRSRAEAEHSKKVSKNPTEVEDRSCLPGIESDLNLNDFACACAVLAELLGKKQLARQDQETVGFWCATYDMRGEALPLIGKKFKQYFSKNGEPPKSLKYFNNMLAEGCKKQPPHMELGKKLRTV